MRSYRVWRRLSTNVDTHTQYDACTGVQASYLYGSSSRDKLLLRHSRSSCSSVEDVIASVGDSQCPRYIRSEMCVSVGDLDLVIVYPMILVFMFQQTCICLMYNVNSFTTRSIFLLFTAGCQNLLVAFNKCN